MSIAIDLALIIFIIISISFASRKGFIYSLFSFIGYILAAGVGFALSGACAEYVTDGFLRERICDKICSELSTESIESIAEAIDNALPGFLSRLLDLNDGGLSEYIGEGKRSTAEAIFDNSISPVLTTVIKAAFVIIILALLFFLVRKIAWGAKSLVHHTFLRPVDIFFGGLLGFAKGCVIIICTMFVVRFILMISGGEIAGFGYGDIDNSHLFKFFYRDLLSL